MVLRIAGDADVAERVAEIDERAADFTARRVRAALASLAGTGPAYTESGR